MGQERSNRLVTGHTYVVSGDVYLKNQHHNLFQHGDSGFTKEEDEEYFYDDDDDDTKIVKSRVNRFSRGELKVHMMSFGICTARYEPVSYCWTISKAS